MCKSCFWCASFLNNRSVNECPSCRNSELESMPLSLSEKFDYELWQRVFSNNNGIALAMKHIFSKIEIYQLDIADGLKELLYEKKYDLNSLLQSDAESMSSELGIEEYVAKIIIDSARKKTTE